MDMNTRIHAATVAAQQAFWAKVADQFPEIETGDLPPSIVASFSDACRNVVKSWVDCNQPVDASDMVITLDQLLATTNHHDLDQLLRQADRASKYGMNLNVAWDYWHYGRHAEFAAELGLHQLSRLFSAAWQIEHRVHHVNDVEAEVQRSAIKEEYATA